MSGPPETTNNSAERWTDMPGFTGYLVSTEGRAAKLQPNGVRELIKPVIRNGRSFFRLRQGRHRRMILAERAVAEAFVQPSLPGCGIRHRNGDILDCRAENLEAVPRMLEGYRVVKIDVKGRVMAEYVSAGEAARQNYMNYQTVLNRCRGKTKDDFEHDGFSFRFKADMKGGEKDGRVSCPEESSDDLREKSAAVL